MFSFKGLFHRTISQSGTATCTWAITPKGKPKALAEQVAGLFDCPAHRSKDLISCLRKQDAYKLHNAELAIKVSCQKHAENGMKLNRDKIKKHHEEHSRPGSTISLLT
jgi:carboxylesterase type B